MDDCEYMLPCGRCNKYDIYCDAENDDNLPNEYGFVECEHEWKCVDKWHSPDETGRANYRGKFICRKCDTVVIKDLKDIFKNRRD